MPLVVQQLVLIIGLGMEMCHLIPQQKPPDSEGYDLSEPEIRCLRGDLSLQSSRNCDYCGGLTPRTSRHIMTAPKSQIDEDCAARQTFPDQIKHFAELQGWGISCF